MLRLGIDIGGTGIKGGLVDLTKGELATPRYRLTTPKGAKPEDVFDVVRQVAEHEGGEGPVGITFPGVVLNGVIITAANMHESWVGLRASQHFTELLGRPVHTMNDADAAGVAEMRYGCGRGRSGVTIMVTLGTGIGTAMFLDGKLVPNTEFGHIEIKGKDAETLASGKAQEREDLSWREYAKRVQTYLGRLEALLSPSLFIIGGGVSKESAKFLPIVKTRAEIEVAQLLNSAGIVGAAALAQEMLAELAPE